MLKFPLHNAALDLIGKPLEEGAAHQSAARSTPEVREIVAADFARVTVSTQRRGHVQNRDSAPRPRQLVQLQPTCCLFSARQPMGRWCWRSGEKR